MVGSEVLTGLVFPVCQALNQVWGGAGAGGILSECIGLLFTPMCATRTTTTTPSTMWGARPRSVGAEGVCLKQSYKNS